MNASQDRVSESTLLLAQAERADLAFQLLQSLSPLVSEVRAEEFAAELYERIAAHRRGEVRGFSLEKTRVILRQRLAPEISETP